METNNDDEEPQICTVFSSAPSAHSNKTIFDTIAFSVPKKENSVLSPTSPFSEDDIPSTSATVPNLDVSPKIEEESLPPTSVMFESLSMSYMATGPTSLVSASAGVQGGESVSSIPVTPAFSSLPYFSNEQVLATTPDPIGQSLNEESLRLVSKEIESLSIKSSGGDDESLTSLPAANVLFSNTSEVPFPVAVGGTSMPTFTEVVEPLSGYNYPFGGVAPTPTQAPQNTLEQEQSIARPIDSFTSTTYSAKDSAYDAWIPNQQTTQVLMGIATAVNSATFFPDKAHMTTPGVIYKEDLVDKVAVNMSRIFGEIEASKRQILTADSVTQDDNGIRELIKLGCYRSAINLTKRLLTLYGQGPGKIGQFSKHTPHSLQLWMTRIALLVRIREFKIAESELEAFKDFENPDMFYEYYQDVYGQGRKGSIIPFHFRLMAAEIPQYASKDYNGSTNKLSKLLQTIQQILKNVNDGVSEDGSSITLDEERKDSSMQIWTKREIRVYYSLTNAFLLAKDFPNALRHLTILREKDKDKNAQVTSAIGRLFLQYGDLPTAQKYFKAAAAIRSNGSESERVENLVDAALYFIAQGVYSEAFTLLKEALVIQPDNFMITNNMSVCLLYLGKVKESLQLMESTVQNNKPQLLQENVILNLSTIYELENSDGVKKNGLLKLISEYKGDGINLASLKMPNLI